MHNITLCFELLSLQFGTDYSTLPSTNEIISSHRNTFESSMNWKTSETQTALLHLLDHLHEEEQQEVESQLEEEEVEAEEGEDADLMTDLNLPKLIWMLRWRITRRT